MGFLLLDHDWLVVLSMFFQQYVPQNVIFGSRREYFDARLWRKSVAELDFSCIHVFHYFSPVALPNVDDGNSLIVFFLQVYKSMVFVAVFRPFQCPCLSSDQIVPILSACSFSWFPVPKRRGNLSSSDRRSCSWIDCRSGICGISFIFIYSLNSKFVVSNFPFNKVTFSLSEWSHWLKFSMILFCFFSLLPFVF